jgi:hypothetical protein
LNSLLFWAKQEKEGEHMKEYIILVNQINVQVSEEVYRTFNKYKWHKSYDRKKRLMKETSFEGLCDNGISAELEAAEIPKSLEDEVILNLMIDKLRNCLSKLPEDEYQLIYELFFKERSIRDVVVLK